MKFIAFARTPTDPDKPVSMHGSERRSEDGNLIKLPRHSEQWLLGYLAERSRSLLLRDASPEILWVAVADHYEPLCNHASEAVAVERVRLWRERWPQACARIGGDSLGRPAKYTYFYPQEEYRYRLLEPLAEMVRQGIADVEVHIHHDRDGEADFIERIRAFCRVLTEEHGLLRTHRGRTVFGFIHGNWALDNSLPGGRWCGLNNEITLLRELGCYADFTMPSGNSPSQASTVNSIYWCTDDPDRPKSHDRGRKAKVADGVHGDLLIIPGPFGLRWKGRLVPRLETGELAGYDLASPDRVRRWFDLAPRLGKHKFLKLYAHGTQERNSGPLLGRGLEQAYTLIRQEAERRRWQCLFASCWEIYRAIEDLCLGNDPLQAASRPGAGAAP